MMNVARLLVCVVLVAGGCQKPVVPASVVPSPTGPFTATVVSYDLNVEWDHFEDGSFATRDRLQLKLDSVGARDGELAVSLLPTDLPDDSPIRISGTRLTFSLESPIEPDFHLGWGALTDVRVIEER